MALLQELGYKPLVSDLAVYYNSTTGIFIVTFVDDCLLFGPSIRKINALKRQLAKVYAIEDRGLASFFLEVQIIRDKANRLLYLQQKQYIEEALQHYGFADAKTVSIPLQPGLLGRKSSPAAESLSRADQRLYQSIVGTTMYAII